MKPKGWGGLWWAEVFTAQRIQTIRDVRGETGTAKNEGTVKRTSIWLKVEGKTVTVDRLTGKVRAQTRMSRFSGER